MSTLLLSCVGVFAALALCIGCGSPKAPNDATRTASSSPRDGGAAHATNATAPQVAWPGELQHEALLIADRIEIEGPPGLIAHVAIRQADGEIDYRTETTKDGLLQTWQARPGVEIRGQLDNTVLAALQSVRVLERYSARSVDMHASGAVLYKSNGPQGWTETRVPTWKRSYPLP